jgi:hypothetical protein
VAADPTREGQTEVSCLKKVPEFHLRFQNFFCTALGQKNYPGSVVKARPTGIQQEIETNVLHHGGFQKKKKSSTSWCMQ